MNEHLDTLLDTAAGTLRGRLHDGLRVFHAVPYAAAPVGPLRFAAPAAPPAWDGIREAGSPGPIAPQLPSRLSLAMGDIDQGQDEDCLSVTVWTPAAPAAPRPVLVWFHGGGYISGAGDLPWYDGATLAREGDLVVVNVNYRIGALGYLYAPGVSPGNLGLLDQRAALDWVQGHIASFGGDPSQVTVMGQSAGAHSIALLLARPGETAAPPFQRAILQSAPLGLALHEPAEAALTGAVFLRALGIEPDAPDARERACAASTAEILQAQVAALRFMLAKAAPGDPAALPFLPLADGVVAPSAAEMVPAMRAAAARVDVLAGVTRDEANVFYYGVEALRDLTEAPIPAADRARLAARRPGASAAQLLADYASEETFGRPSLAWATDAARAGRQTYVYQFDWQSPHPGLGAGHCLELPFVFGTAAAFADAPMLAGADAAQVEALSAQLRGCWLGFTRSGNPNHAGVPTWPAFESTRQATMRFDTVSGAVGDLGAPEADHA